ncbi:MAG: DUF2160 domain-containing protein [Gammaproteobacteria bacterium]|nr:DUF2160 domain-containing protein [Gammaproteobacteria bacterium]
MSFAWMAWTLPSALFFICIAGSLVTMTLLEVYRPTIKRRGFLPLETTRGDRFFMSLLGSAFIHVIWLAVSDSSVFWASGLSVAYAVLLMRRG